MYGVSIRSDLHLPVLRQLPREPASAPTIALLRGAPDELDEQALDARARARAKGDWFHFEVLGDGSSYFCYTELFEFLVSPDGKRIACFPQRGSAESFQHYLLNQALSCSMVRLGIEPLHGTVLVRDGRALALLGGSGFGKSTLAAALLGRGFKLLTDDLMVLREVDGGFSVYPGLPRIKLFPSMAKRAIGRSAAGVVPGVPMVRGTSKLIIPLGADQVCTQEQRLHSVYVLSPPRRGTTGIRIRNLSPSEAFFELIRNTFNAVDFDGARVARQFAFADRVAGTAVFKRLSYPRRTSRLDELCDRVIRDSQG